MRRELSGWSLFTIVFLVFFLTRLIVIFKGFDGYLFSEELLDACIMPAQFVQGKSILGGGSNYGLYGFNWSLMKIFGFSPYLPRIFKSLIVAGSIALMATTAARLYGNKSALLFSIITLLSAPLITHSVYATAIAYGLPFIAITLWALSLPLNFKRSAILGLAIPVSLLFYPAGILVAVPLVIFHFLFFKGDWSKKNLITLAVSFLVSLGFIFALRNLFDNTDVARWGGGKIIFKDNLPAIWIMIKDLFYSTITWNAYNYKFPSFNPLLIPFLLASFVLLRGREQSKSRKWVSILICSSLSAIVIASIAPSGPGIRRAFGAIPLLILASSVAAGALLQNRKWKKIAWAILTLSMSFEIYMSVRVLQNEFPMHGLSWGHLDLYEYASKMKSPVPQTVVIAKNSNFYSGWQVRCLIDTDSDITHKFGKIENTRLKEVPGVFPKYGSILLISEVELTDQQISLLEKMILPDQTKRFPPRLQFTRLRQLRFYNYVY